MSVAREPPRARSNDSTRSHSPVQGRAQGPVQDPAQSSPAVPGLEITGEVGSGIRGAVYTATDGRRTLALKVFRRGVRLHQNELERFLRTSTDRLKHPNLAALDAFGELPDGSIYYASPFLRGDSLDRLLHDLRRGSTERPSLSVFSLDARGERHPDLIPGGIEILTEALEGLALAHKAGIPHRRITPRNLHLTPGGRLVLTDFGGEGTTEAGEDLVYRAPEQLDPYPEGIGPRSDVYSFGVILYEVFAGTQPFNAASPREMKEAIQEGRFPPPRAVRPELPAGLEAVITKAMALDPAERYVGAGDLAQDLRCVLRGEEPAALTDRTPLVILPQRREWGVWVRVAAAAVILSGFVALLWPGGSRNAGENEAAARRERHQNPAAAGVSGTESLAPGEPHTSARVAVESLLSGTSLPSDLLARQLSSTDQLPRAAALARLELEVRSGIRPPGDALLASWAVRDSDRTAKVDAIRILGLSRDGDAVLRLLAVAEDLPERTIDVPSFQALEEILLEIADPAATAVLCATALEEVLEIDRAPAPASVHLEPNFRLEIKPEDPRDLTARWIRARGKVDPEGLVEASASLLQEDEPARLLVETLEALGPAAPVRTLMEIAQKAPPSVVPRAIEALASTGGLRELLELALTSAWPSAQEQAVRALGTEGAGLYLPELRRLSVASPDGAVRRAAFEAISRYEDAETQLVLVDALGDPDLRASALAWAERLPPEGPPEVFLRILESADYDTRGLAIERLAVSPFDVLPALARQALDRRRGPREAAVHAIAARGELTDLPRALKRLFAHPWPGVGGEPSLRPLEWNDVGEAFAALGHRLRRRLDPALSRSGWNGRIPSFQGLAPLFPGP